MMPELNFKSYLSAFKSITGVLAGVGALVPGFAYFTTYAPPFGEIALLTTAFATATIFITYYYSPRGRSKPEQTLPQLIKLALKALIISFLLLILYLIAIDLCSVQIPGSNKRVQIGFDQFDWSLTDYGKQVKRENPSAQPQNWLAEESYKAGVAKLFWKPWAIYLSGAFLILMFTGAFTLWTFGWSLIAKQNAISRVEITTPPANADIPPG